MNITKINNSSFNNSKSNRFRGSDLRNYIKHLRSEPPVIYIWRERDVILSGAYEYRLCKEHGIPYSIRFVNLSSCPQHVRRAAGHRCGSHEYTPSPDNPATIHKVVGGEPDRSTDRDNEQLNPTIVLSAESPRSTPNTLREMCTKKFGSEGAFSGVLPNHDFRLRSKTAISVSKTTIASDCLFSSPALFRL